jgi:predicted SprT family Zn-dependent metalloprotease
MNDAIRCANRKPDAQGERTWNRLRKVRINRDVQVPTHRFTEYFKEFDNVEAVRSIFGEETEKVLDGLRVDFVSGIDYMRVNDSDGDIMINPHYLKHGDLRDIYLDLIHELVHVKQFREGRKLVDRRYGYTDRVTEIEAYRHTVEEARKLGMTDEEIFQYLKTECMSKEEHRRLAEILNVRVSKHS